MRRLLPLLTLAALLMRPGMLTGALTAEDHLSVHHAFQDTPGGRVNNPALSDPALQFKPLRRKVVEELRAGRAPLWNPDLYGGAPLLADAQSAPLSVATLLRLPAWMPEGVAANLSASWVMLWLGLGTALLSRRLGLGAGAAALAGVAALSGPFPQVWLLHPHAASFAWWPWLWWSMDRLSAGGSPAWVALSLLGALAGGHPETAAHGLILGVIWALVRVRGARAWGGLVLGVTAGVLLSAPLWAPVLELLLDSATAQSHGGNRVQPRQLLDLLWPNWLGHPATEEGVKGGVWADGVLHPGLGTLALALLALGRGPGRWLWLAWAACLALALSGLGAPLNNSRLGGAGALFLALAAGLGASALSPRGLALAGLLVLGSASWARRLDHQAVPWSQVDPAPAAWTQRLGELVGDGRVVGLDWALQPNTGSLVGLRDLRGYDLPVSKDTERLERVLDARVARPWFPIAGINARNLRVMRFAGVKVLLWPPPEDPPLGVLALPELDLGPAPVRAFWLEPEAPQAWLAFSAVPAHSADAALESLATGIAGRRNPRIEGLQDSLIGSGDPSPVRLERSGGGAARVQLDPLPQAAVLVWTERWDAGWRAKINGQDRPVLRAMGLFQAVQLSPGDQVVELEYRPQSWVFGLRLMTLGALLTLALGLFSGRARA